MAYIPTIGLEIHVELKTKSKMFCSCSNNADEKKPNVNICPVCMGYPGTLPVINEEAVRKIIKTVLGLNCEVIKRSKFYRKLYFYPDLPKGYQISQDISPIGKNGFLKIDGRKIKIHEVHLEEDVGSLIHPKGTDYSLVNFNRAGVPLMELVTEPDITSAIEARKFAEELQLILRYLDVSEANMEKGQMRVEVNVSLRRQNSKELGTKVEIKNLNSFQVVEKATNFEIERQEKILEEGKEIIPETRGWDDEKKITLSQRKKGKGSFSTEDFHAPEPNLPALNLQVDDIEKIKLEIPELPQQKRERFKKEYELGNKETEFFASYRNLSNYFEKVMSELKNWIKEGRIKEKVERPESIKLVKICANYIITDLQGLLKGKSVVGKDFSITPENFAEFVYLIYEGKISSKIAKLVLGEMLKTGSDPSHIIKEKGLVQITNEAEIEKAIKDVLTKNQKVVEDYKKGKETALQYLIGQVMAETRGKANPQSVQKILKILLTK